MHAGADAGAREPTFGARESGEALVGGIGSEILRDYFAQASMTQRKRHSELQVYHELRQGFPEAQIAACVEYLARKGLPGSGERCHSPMAFLSKAMGQVLGLVQAEATKRDEAQARVERERAERERKAHEAAEEELRVELLEAEFVRRYPSEEAQEAVLRPYRQQFGMFVRQPGVMRRLAIGAWNSDLLVQNSLDIRRD